MLSAEPVGPSGGQVPCSACGAIIDPLRAGHVAIFNSRFHYFCGLGQCRAAFLGRLQHQPPVPLGPAQLALPENAASLAQRELLRSDGGALAVDAVTRPIRGAEATPPPDSSVPTRIRVDEEADFFEPLPEAAAADLALPPEPAERQDAGGVLVALAAVAGLVAVALDFAEPRRLVLAARAVLVMVGASAIVGRALTTRADAADVHRLAVILPPVLAALLPPWALLAGGRELASRASFFAATMIAVSASCLWLVSVAVGPVAAARRWLERQLDVPGRRLAEGAAGAAGDLGPELCPGELVAVETGEVVPVDLEIREGEAEVQPWMGASQLVRRRPGDVLVAGARVIQGQVRGICTAAGMDRAFARSLLAPNRRCDVHGQVPRLARQLTERWSWVAALGAALVVTLLDWRHFEPIAVAMVTIAVWAALTRPHWSHASARL
jgi:Cu+-exporting ATPase